MKLVKSGRGFQILEHTTYANEPIPDARLIQQSSAIGDYEDSFDKPGSSYLWIGKDHHLNREEVKQLVSHMEYWLKHGNLGENQ